MNPNQDPNAAPDAAAPQPSAEAPVTPAPESTTPTPTTEPVAPALDVTPAPETPVVEPTPVNPFAAAGTPAAPSNPTEPVVPASPFAAATPIAGAPIAGGPAPKPKNTKKIILLASAIGGVVLLAVVGVIIFLLLTTVSKQDYADAAKQYNAVSQAYSDLDRLDSSFSSVNSSNSANLDETVAEAEAKMVTVKTENESLGKLKAVSVGEGKKLYDEFDNKLTAYISYNEGVATTLKSLSPALDLCSSSAADTNDMVGALRKCESALNGVTDMPNPEFKAYVDTLKVQYAEIIKLYEDMSSITDPYGSQYDQYRALRDKSYEITDALTDASTTLKDSLNNKVKELDPKASADALRTFLNEQQRK